jgi:hypothetical protein
MQVFQSPYQSVLQCARATLQREGFRAFYASYPATVLMNIPFMAVNFATYESLKQILSPARGNYHINNRPSTHVIIITRNDAWKHISGV